MDRAPAMSSQKARGLIEKELEMPVNMVFKEWESASLNYDFRVTNILLNASVTKGGVS